MNMKTVRVGVIGLGVGWSHIKAYRAHPQADVAAICDIDTNRLAARADEFGIARTYTDWREMLRAESLDAVSVCLPNHLHAPVSIEAMRSGCHVLCEKPLTDTLAAAGPLADAVRASGRVLMAGMTMRYWSHCQALKRICDRGDLGSIYGARAVYSRKNGIPGAGGWFTRRESAGGGAIMDIGVHVLDLAWWLMGRPEPVSASAMVYPEIGCAGAPGIDVDTHALGCIRFNTGAMLQLEAGWASHRAADETGVWLYGERAGLSTHPPAVYGAEAGVATTMQLATPASFGKEGEIGHFLTCIEQGVVPDASIDDGVQMMRMLDALYRSAAQHQEVAVNS